MGVARVDAPLGHDHQVAAAIVQCLGNHVTITRQRQVANRQRYAGRQARQHTAERRYDSGRHIVRRHQGKAPLTAAGVEVQGRLHHLPDQA
ncbi:hypothetical protein D3C79_764610 [compost metagenome]